MPNIEWLSPESIDDVIESLRCRYADDPISIINEEPIEYVLHLEALSCYYDDDVYRLAAVIFRSIIQGHPLQDGNKRMGMLLGTYFLKINGYTLTAGNDEFLNTALEIARGELHLQGIYQWLLKRAQPG
ncbi:MAG: type II toxin-antitoxin system death-on-curing family toxin [Pyramidobacter sp.]|nr:type II toxin-antitoxin system death-on-curing family toxin [Pyramidobacter sp.]